MGIRWEYCEHCGIWHSDLGDIGYCEHIETESNRNGPNKLDPELIKYLKSFDQSSFDICDDYTIYTFFSVDLNELTDMWNDNIRIISINGSLLPGRYEVLRIDE